MRSTEQDLRCLNTFFSDAEWCTLVKPFCVEQGSVHKGNYSGRIEVSTAKGPVTFTVALPPSYPLGEARFHPHELAGYAHQNTAPDVSFGGSLCLATPEINHFAQRLAAEAEKLLGWLDRYYVHELPDEHYEYVPISSPIGVKLLFDEEASDHSADRLALAAGTFQYGQLLGSSRSDQQLIFVANHLAGLPNRFSGVYNAKIPFVGVWTIISREPVLLRKLRITSWGDLLQLLPDDFFSTLRRLTFDDVLRRSTPNHPLLKNYFLVAIGYRIPGAEGDELTWDILRLPIEWLRRKDSSPLRTRERLAGSDRHQLRWGETANTSYSRFFGRGSISPALATKKVLLLGVGALGSTIAELLVRGGLRDLTIYDGDVVAPGNVCRSRHRFCDTDSPKASALATQLQRLSPFADVKWQLALQAPSSIQAITELVAKLEQFDLILDCTASIRVLLLLEQLSLEMPVYNLCVTDGAAQLLCTLISAANGSVERREQFFAMFNAVAPATFREGTGCWHPTFQAAASHIDLLSSLAVRQLDQAVDAGHRMSSFSIQQVTTGGAQVDKDVVFYQDTLALRLIVPNSCLEHIATLCHQHYPKEIGGVLLGAYSEDRATVIVSRVVVPAKFRNSRTSFIPDAAAVNQELATAYTASGGRLIYVGDWHSHPDGPAEPSPKDRRSIAKQAEHPQVHTNSPLLLISQFRRKRLSPNFYVYQNGMLHPYTRLNNGKI
jgi:integrative and conjugative element protein (TIGR02256 family)